MSNYYKPTPKKWRKLGDAMLAVSLTAVPADVAGYKAIALTVFVTGVIGKFLTNFFADEV